MFYVDYYGDLVKKPFIQNKEKKLRFCGGLLNSAVVIGLLDFIIKTRVRLEVIPYTV